MAKKLKNKIALITGATKGLGRSIALRYAKEGCHTILLGKNLKDLEAVDDEIKKLGEKATLIPFDLQDIPSLGILGSELLKKFGKLDILVGNAAILGQLGPMHQIPLKVWNDVLSVNLTANWGLLRICDPLLRLSPAGRLIFVTCNVTQTPHPYWGPYIVSKSALETMIKTYALENAHSTLRTNLVSFDAIQSSLRAQAMPGEPSSSLPKPEILMQTFVDLALNNCKINGKTLQL